MDYRSRRFYCKCGSRIRIGNTEEFLDGYSSKFTCKNTRSYAWVDHPTEVVEESIVCAISEWLCTEAHRERMEACHLHTVS